MAKELKSLGLSQVQINIDSVEKGKHDAIRGKKGSFERALEALKNSMEAGITCVSETVLTKHNEGEITDIFRLARSMGIQRCRVWDMTPSSGCARDNSELLPSDYISTLQQVADFARQEGAKHIEIGDPLFLSHVSSELQKSGGYCAFAMGMIVYIATNGDVFFCCTLRDRMYNILEEIGKGNDIRTVHRDAIKRYLERFSEADACKSCKEYKRCQGGCYTRRDFSSDNSDYLCKMRV